MPFILANAWLASALIKNPEFRLPYMAILAGLASDLPPMAKTLPRRRHDASVMGRIRRPRVRTAQFARTGMRGRVKALVGKVWGE
jgi:hypothetical protein